MPNYQVPRHWFRVQGFRASGLGYIDPKPETVNARLEISYWSFTTSGDTVNGF